MAQWQRVPLPIQEIQETQVLSLSREDPLEEEMATCSSILCLENSMDRGAWWAMVHAVAESDTTERLNNSALSYTRHLILIK